MSPASRFASLLGVLAAAIALVSIGCKRQPANRTRSSPSAGAGRTPARKRAVHLSPLRAPRGDEDLPLKGFHPAVVIAPLGATDSRPVLVALHAEGADPVATCEAWHRISDYGFVLCPRGVADKTSTRGAPRYTFGSAHDTVLELRAALSALRRHFGDYVAPGPVVLAGVSLGALRAVWILREEPAYFARVVLVQTARDPWSSGIATIFARRGGKRVLFVCAASACQQRVRNDVVLTRRSGAQARSSELVVGDASLDDRLKGALAPDFRWLVADDPAWKPPAAPR